MASRSYALSDGAKRIPPAGGGGASELRTALSQGITTARSGALEPFKAKTLKWFRVKTVPALSPSMRN
ncbi:MAG: hypothetical protein LBQ79_08630 [Deltaproteobacteria bacterium]|nr:hypothetical protein [Deltaproteobacteria bacterium]